MMIEVTCTGSELVDFTTLTSFQGNLKERKQHHIDSIKRLMITDGFSYPFFVWKNGDVKYVLDGHGRLEALRQFVAEGYDIPELPMVLIEAADEKDAKVKLLKLNSKYGDITAARYRQYIGGIELDNLAEIAIQFDTPEILKVEEPTDAAVKEAVQKSKSGVAHITVMCPSCGKEEEIEIPNLFQGMT